MSYGRVARYREVEVLSCSPERRVVLLFAHLVTSLRLAIAHDAQRRRGESVASLGKAHAILEELLYSLDHEQGGEIAANLAALYERFLEDVLQAQKTPAPQLLEAVLRCVTELHEAFDAAAAQLESGVAASAAGA